MKLAIAQAITIPNQHLEFPGIKKTHPFHLKLQMMALLISNLYHLQDKFYQMHHQLYQQRGEKLYMWRETVQNQNKTTTSNDEPTFVVKGVSIHCT